MSPDRTKFHNLAWQIKFNGGAWFLKPIFLRLFSNVRNWNSSFLLILSCQSNYSRQCEGKVKKEVVKSNIFALKGPESGRSIGLILSTAAHICEIWFPIPISAPSHLSQSSRLGMHKSELLTLCNLDVLWRLWGQERNEKRGRKLEIDTRVRVEENF